MSNIPTRRDAIAAGAALAATLGTSALPAQQPSGPPKRKRLAAVNSIYYKSSHAYHIIGRFLNGYTKDGKLHTPPFEIERMWNDQYGFDAKTKDLARPTAKKRNITITETIPEALGGAGNLDVDGVLLIAEHGDYSRNNLGQIQYPRAEWFEQIVDVMKSSKKSVPVFIDKALSYDTEKVIAMYKMALANNIPLMAGSSLPVTWRRPEWEPEIGAKITEAVVCFYADMEIYGFHALETMQCLLERRRGGETGVKSIQTIKGADVWRFWERGVWDKALTEAALRKSPSRDFGHPRDHVENPFAFLVEYNDGTKATLINLHGYVSDITAGVKLAGDSKSYATHFQLPPPPGARFFNPLVWHIEQFFTTGKSPYPIERTLLTSILLDYAHRSAAEGGKRIPTPALEQFVYLPEKASFFFRGSASDE